MTGHKLAGIRFVLEDGKCRLVSLATVVWGRQDPSPHPTPVLAVRKWGFPIVHLQTLFVTQSPPFSLPPLANLVPRVSRLTALWGEPWNEVAHQQRRLREREIAWLAQKNICIGKP